LKVHERAMMETSHPAKAGGRRGARAIPRSRLMRYLALGYTLLIAYASLYPFSGWRAAPVGLLDFVAAPWPRWYTLSDLSLNVLAYVPFGFFAALSSLGRFGPINAAIGAAVLGTSLSLFMECLQQFTGTRVASNLDLLSNGLGALAGALLAATMGERWVLSGRLYQARQRLFVQERMSDLGFVLLLLWLFTQLHAQLWLFGNGDGRWLMATSALGEFDPDVHRWLESAVVASNLAAVCLLVQVMARPRESVAGLLLALVGAALGLKIVAAITLFRQGDAALYLTPAAMLGIPAGIVLYLLLRNLPRAGAALAGAAMLALGVLLVNLAPENPYIVASFSPWRHGHFLSFHGLTRLVSTLWPLLAFCYLCAVAAILAATSRTMQGRRCASNSRKSDGSRP
jgi:VanZ family protein